MSTKRMIIAFGFTTALLLVPSALGQNVRGDVALDWHTVDGGGWIFSTGSEFE